MDAIIFATVGQWSEQACTAHEEDKYCRSQIIWMFPFVLQATMSMMQQLKHICFPFRMISNETI